MLVSMLPGAPAYGLICEEGSWATQTPFRGPEGGVQAEALHVAPAFGVVAKTPIALHAKAAAPVAGAVLSVTPKLVPADRVVADACVKVQEFPPTTQLKVVPAGTLHWVGAATHSSMAWIEVPNPFEEERVMIISPGTQRRDGCAKRGNQISVQLLLLMLVLLPR